MYKLASVPLLVLAAAVVGINAVCVNIPEGHKDLIVKSWDIAKRNGNLAPDTFIHFFERNPSYQAIFHKFATVPIKDLKSNGDFLAQAYTVLAGLNVVVEALGSDTLLDQQIKHLGIAHKARQAKPWHFDELAMALVATMKQELGDAFTPQAQDAWIDALNMINKAIVANIKDAADVADTETHLTPNQVKVIKATWDSVRDQRQAMGEEIFLHLFQNHAGYQQLFPKFATVSNDALATNEDFKHQIGQVVNRFDEVVHSLDNQMVLVGELIYLGHTHFPRKVNREHFTYFGVELVKSLGSHGVSADAQNVWRQVLPILLEQVIDHLN